MNRELSVAGALGAGGALVFFVALAALAIAETQSGVLDIGGFVRDAHLAQDLLGPEGPSHGPRLLATCQGSCVRSGFDGGDPAGHFVAAGGKTLFLDPSFDGGPVGGQVPFNDEPDLITAPGPPAVVPEPATWGLTLLGLGSIGAALRSRRRFEYSF